MELDRYVKSLIYYKQRNNLIVGDNEGFISILDLEDLREIRRFNIALSIYILKQTSSFII